MSTVRFTFLGASLAAAALLTGAPARASDHQDGPARIMAPDTDINDVYLWQNSGGSTVINMAMTVFPGATKSARFSDAAYYVFHTYSQDKYKDPTTAPINLNIICKFDAQQRVECWAAGEYAAGNPGTSAGVSSATGKLRIYAGLRQDPFFFNLEGFNAFRAAVKTGVTGGGIKTFDPQGCPTLPMRAALVSQLREKPGSPGTLGTDAFAKQNALALVVALDRSVIGLEAQIVSVWAGTHRLP